MTDSNSKQKTAPVSVGVIMDGNRRWARTQGLPHIEGHRRGAERLRDLVRWSGELGVRYLTVYAFSTENWNRSRDEIAGLQRVLLWFFERYLGELVDSGVRVSCIGDRSRFDDEVLRAIGEVEERTRKGEHVRLLIALSYGGRAEITDAARRLCTDVCSGAVPTVNERVFARYLWTADIPDPDLIIRTGGAQRLSNFLPWQSVYSELFFTDTYWPAFSRAEYEEIIRSFAEIRRNFGT